MSRAASRSALKNLNLLTLPCLNIQEAVTYCMHKTNPTKGKDIHAYDSRGRDNYTGHWYTNNCLQKAGIQFVSTVYQNTLKMLNA